VDLDARVADSGRARQQLQPLALESHVVVIGDGAST
jgi:hypothetical protein